MSRILIVHASRHGHTARIARHLADRLAGAGRHVETVDVTAADGDPDPRRYDGVLVGGSVSYGRHDRRLVAFVRRNRHALAARPTGLFSVSLAAAHPEHDETTRRHVQHLARRTDWQPELVARFAGDLPYTHYGPLTRLVAKRHAAALGLSTDGSHDHTYTDWDRVDRFADAFGALIARRRTPSGASRTPDGARMTLVAVGAVGAIGAAARAYQQRWRPRVRDWGTTEAERAQPLPGDALVTAPISTSTMAITIDAPPTDVWPWLAQLGSRRAGWYSYDIVDNLGTPSATTILPAFQHLQEGDLVPANRRGRIALPVARLEPEQYVVFGHPVDAATRRRVHRPTPIGDTTWGFHLRALPGDRTRLIVRTTVGAGRSRTLSAAAVGFWEVFHHVMQRRQLVNLKQRAEGLLGERVGTSSPAPGAASPAP